MYDVMEHWVWPSEVLGYCIPEDIEARAVV